MKLFWWFTGTIILISFNSFAGNQVIRINQLGYMPHSVKVAVFLSDESTNIRKFTLYEALTDREVFSGTAEPGKAENWGMAVACRLDFSEYAAEGGYYVKVGDVRSPKFRIHNDVYRGTADFLLNYLRQQRCGYNPYLKDSCHLHDGMIVDHPTRSGEIIDVTGGWHDASDYLQYSTTSVNTLFQMMFAYENFPDVYDDKYDANGHQGANGVPDILDEIKWGLQWMLKMNPGPGEMYNQIADDRDHIGYRLPVDDPADYGLGKYRPVYYVTGKPQGLAKYKNTSTGVSSIAGKFSSGFAMAARLFEANDAEFAGLLREKALDAWRFALSDTGYTQTACNVSPYYYTESNFADDLELAAAQLFRLTGDEQYIKEATYWGEQEPVTPWMEKGEARHYEYYPFVNLGHHFLMQNDKPEFAEYYAMGLNHLYERGKDDPFFNGLPFIWCSNNLVAAAITQARLYHKHTGDSRFLEMEAALRDWLFGCNPWGTAMICGLPGVDDSPMFPHSSYTVLQGVTTLGGLVDGPVYSSIFNSLIGIKLTKEDEYAPWNNGKAVYHDDIGDYSTNEPTMDGTASLSFYLASLEKEGVDKATGHDTVKDDYGAIIRVNPAEKNIYLVFTADTLFEGGQHVLNVLEKKNIKGSFFFTGNFLRKKVFHDVIKKIKKQVHYVGIHSDLHLLYCDWEERDSTLVTFSEFETDIKNNFKELNKFGIAPVKARYFIPPYEWYNREIIGWSRKSGLEAVNFTPGTGTNADYTTPDMENYKTSVRIYANLLNYEKNNPLGLNGAVLLLHPGTAPERKDKFYRILEDMIRHFSSRGYQFKSLN
ncbi:MAG: glycoside hydrolase family 9 protein [Mariniphaga sp.]